MTGHHTFDNGYGASVINHGYGSDQGLLEMAVLHDGKICYKSGVTDDVIGWLTETEVAVTLRIIKNLPKNSRCDHGR